MSGEELDPEWAERALELFERRRRKAEEHVGELEQRSRRHDRLDTGLGIAVVVLAGAAALSVPIDLAGDWFTGTTAALAAAVSAAQQRFQPAQRARDLLALAARWGTLAERCRSYCDLELASSEPTAIRAELERLAQEDALLRGGGSCAPGPRPL